MPSRSMQKRAVIVVGSHYAGKSKTINCYFKKLVGIPEEKRKFDIKGSEGQALSQSNEEKRGLIISQSPEEKRIKELEAAIERYLGYQYLVLASRPDGESPSYYKEIKAILEKADYIVTTVEVFDHGDDESYYENKGKEVFAGLSRTSAA